ncbi:MAG: chorismate mutase [Thermoleophilia bacterium]|nr:chorismate mutase [Thermoleophilia bacterium]
MEASWSSDPVVRELRERISAADREVLGAVNRRLELVRELHAYKRERGYPLVDPAREDELVGELEQLNDGPLSSDGLRSLYGLLLDVIKREAGAAAPTRPA